MAENPDSPQPQKLGQPLGPFMCAAISTAMSSALLIGLFERLFKLTMFSVLTVVLPVMSTATTLVAISMAWAFVSMGKHKRQPRWVMAMGILIAITIVELLVATSLTEGGR